MAADGSPTELSDDEFDEFVEGHDVALIDFWAPWCGPCKQMDPILKELSKEREDIAIGKINTDDNPKTPQKFGVMSIPTLLLFDEGEVVDQMVGALPKDDIVDRLDDKT